ncbi:ankyrin repeat containing protein [Finch poxvirus]|uniref:Ankyrin repeat containing protein n=2 Tax=unclassified Avipoxvirus TaxID=336487 RepID=A0AAT9UQL2_9POXV|nr:ankyrin repeat containing protein [Finch poxvirus]UOX39073.1 ankyrin repeat containing protein [Finch poxvirus]
MVYIYVYEAIMENDSESLERFLENGFDPNTEYSNLQSPLEMAVMFKNVEAIKILMKYGAKPVIAEQETSCLHDAVLKGDYKMVKELLNDNYINNVLYSGGFTPLCLAVYLNNVSLVKLLLSHSADTDIPNVDQLTPLHIAVANENITIVKLLLNKGANTELMDKIGCTPLMIAVQSGNLEICSILLKKAKHPEIERMILLAVVRGRKGVLRLLFNKGADVNCIFKVNGELCTILEVIKKNYPEILDMEEMVTELVAEVVISKCRMMTTNQEEGFSRNASIITGMESLLRVASKCREEFMYMEKINVGNKNLFEICIMKQRKYISTDDLVTCYHRIISTYSTIEIYKYTMERLVQLMHKRMCKIYYC